MNKALTQNRMDGNGLLVYNASILLFFTMFPHLSFWQNFITIWGHAFWIEIDKHIQLPKTSFLKCNFVFIHPGDIEIGLLERNGGLEVEVIQARGLTMKPGSKGPPGNTPPSESRSETLYLGEAGTRTSLQRRHSADRMQYITHGYTKQVAV